MTTEAFGSVPHSTPPASNRGALSYGGQSSPDELLEGIKHIRRRKEKRARMKTAVDELCEELRLITFMGKFAAHVDDRFKQRTNLPPRILERTKSLVDRINTQHADALVKFPKKTWVKNPDGSYTTMTKFRRDDGKGFRLATTTTREKHMGAHGVELTESLLRGATGIKKDKGPRRGPTPRPPDRVRVKKVRQQFGLGKKTFPKVVAKIEEEAATTPAKQGFSSRNLTKSIGMSKRRISRMARRVRWLRVKGVKISSMARVRVLSRRHFRYVP